MKDLISEEVKDVIIVGAGTCGLMAARELSRAGKKVLILEARDRIGGRIFPLLESEWGYEAQGGAEFIHGEAPLTKEIVTEAGLHVSFLTGWWNMRNDRVNPGPIEIPFENELIDRLKKLEKDISITEFLDTYFSEEKYVSLRESILRRIEGYEAADPSRFNAFSLRDDLTEEGGWKQLSLKEGYGSLVRFLEEEAVKNGAQIILGKEVKEIDFSNKTEDLKIVCADGSQYTGSKIIVTIPISKLSEIVFKPEIPEKKKVASQIGFGHAIKILIRFKTKWWIGARGKNFEKLFFMFSEEQIPTWWTQYPEERNVLTGWLAGPRALALSKLADKEILEIAIKSLSNIFKESVSFLENDLVISKVVNWPQDPFSHGAYSYRTIETGGAIKEITTTIEQKVFFAGEALDKENSSTVEGALQSGKTVTEKILLTP